MCVIMLTLCTFAGNVHSDVIRSEIMTVPLYYIRTAGGRVLSDEVKVFYMKDTAANLCFLMTTNGASDTYNPATLPSCKGLEAYFIKGKLGKVDLGAEPIVDD